MISANKVVRRVANSLLVQLGALTPYEPRLAKKLQKPITELIATTPAVSLLYECVHTCIIGGMLNSVNSSASVSNGLAKLCVSKLSAFLSDDDQNRKSSLAASEG